MVGSSPLTRGKPHNPPLRRLRYRLIPAHAGKTAHEVQVKLCLPAHPRSRGENVGQLTPILRGQGSSPLTRGKRIVPGAGVEPARLIPAHAGKTRPHDCPARTHTAHPRSRGENEGEECTLTLATGSSPLTRGKHEVDRRALVAERLIPAHAGKTRLGDCIGAYVRAHPRSRGENFRRTRR